MFTRPFEVGSTYLRKDGKAVTCIRADRTIAQFSDYEENHYRCLAEYAAKGELEDIKKLGGWDDPLRSGYRYNRDQDRGRCTGTEWNQYAVLPQPTTDLYAMEMLAHIQASHEAYKES